MLLALGLASPDQDSYSGTPEFEEEEETVIITQIVVPPTMGRETDEQDEDEMTEVGYRESPERVKLDIIDVVPMSSSLDRPEDAHKGHKHGSKAGNHAAHKAKREESPAEARFNLAHKDKETTVAQETGL